MGNVIKAAFGNDTTATTREDFARRLREMADDVENGDVPLPGLMQIIYRPVDGSELRYRTLAPPGALIMDIIGLLATAQMDIFQNS